jgi:site-specific recombinase XerD
MIEAYLKEYLYYLKITKNLAKNTINSYERDLNDYLNYLKKNYQININNKKNIKYSFISSLFID